MRRTYKLLIQALSQAATVVLHFRSTFGISRGKTNGMISIAFDDGLKNQFDNAFPQMQERKINGTFYVITDKIKDFSNDSLFMSISELLELQSCGNEIGSHGKTHSRLPTLSDKQIHNECKYSKDVLQSRGLAAENFAYPYGYTNEHVNSIVSQYYRTGRSAYKKPYLINPSPSKFELVGFAGETGDSDVLIRLKYIANLLALKRSYAIVFFHDVVQSDNKSLFTISSKDFASFLDYSISRGLQFLTVNNALSLSGNVAKNI